MNAGAIVVILAVVAFSGLVPHGRGQTNYQQIKSFGGSPGQSPDSPLIEGTDGVLYGTCISSDGPGYGKIFRINKDGSGFAVLKTFAGSPEGRNPRAGLLEGSDGALYGTTYRGGSNDYGSVFKIQKDGSGFETLHSFSLAPGDGIFPFASLIEASDGLLYGTTYQGGAYNQGTIFKLNKNGGGYSTVHHLATPANEGSRPLFGVHEGSDGALYGCAPAGGTNGYGTVFKLNKNGTGFTLLHTFRSYFFGDGSGPTDLMEGSDGTLYGTTSYGGSNSSSHGTVFRLNKDGTGFAVLYSFANGTNASAPQAGLIEGMDGALYGTALVGGMYNTGGLSSGAVFKLNKDGTGFSVLKYLTGSSLNGDAYYPIAPLIQGTNGMLYGTTRFGGTDDVGALFELSTSGAGYQVMFSFKNGKPCGPYAGLVEGPDGMLYGTTFYGGGGEYGTVFKVNKDGSGLTILHRFGNPDARHPMSGLAFGTNGLIYGAGALGGTNEYGAIFTLDTNGLNYSVLHVFGGNATDGGWPYGTLMSGSDGVLYGTTELVGPGGAGTVFSFHTDGSGYTVLHNFTGAFGATSDGGAPYAGLVEAGNGQLYGTTVIGGSNDAGTVYRLNKDGSDYSILYHFTGANGDGGTPRAALIEGSDGRLYGTTERGGLVNIVPTGAGTIFRINRDGTGYEVVYRFTGAADGSSPYAGLSEGTAGALYGTTFSGGAYNGGTVFKIGKDGNGFTVLHDLTGVARDGYNPYGGLLRASDGGYYGTTFSGGETNLGTLFRLYSTQAGVSIGSVQPVSVGTRVGVRGAAWAQSLELQTSTNLNGFWVGIATNAAAVDGTCEFLDFAATNSPIRFYRTRSL